MNLLRFGLLSNRFRELRKSVSAFASTEKNKEFVYHYDNPQEMVGKILCL